MTVCSVCLDGTAPNSDLAKTMQSLLIKMFKLNLCPCHWTGPHKSGTLAYEKTPSLLVWPETHNQIVHRSDRPYSTPQVCCYLMSAVGHCMAAQTAAMVATEPPAIKKHRHSHVTQVGQGIAVCRMVAGAVACCHRIIPAGQECMLLPDAGAACSIAGLACGLASATDRQAMVAE